MHREKLTFFKIFITLGLLISLPLVFILTNSPTEKQDIRSKAKKTSKIPGKVVYIPFSFTKEREKTRLDFKEIPQVRNGFVPSVQLSGGTKFKAVIVDEKGSQVSFQEFSPPSLVAIDSFDKNVGKLKAELRQVKSSNSGLALPYNPKAAFMQIFNEEGEIIETITLKNKKEINNIIDIKEIDYEDLIEHMKKLPTKFDTQNLERLPDQKEIKDFEKIKNDLPNNPRDKNIDIDNDFNKNFRFQINFNRLFPQTQAAGGTFNIAIIGDNYGSNNIRFQNDVNDIAAGLLTVEPFKTYKDSIVFYPKLSTVQICNPTTISPSISCDDSKSLQQASDVPYDKVYVLYNGSYAGYAYVGGTLSYGTNATDQNLAVKQGLFIHELAGHSLGELMDEYSYGTTGNSYASNCSTLASCPSWSNIPGLGCFATCGFTNLYRATDNLSVMNTAYFNGFIAFDKFSSQIVKNKLKNYLSITQTALQITLPSPTLTPFLTLVPTTLIHTQIVTPTPTPSSFILPTITLSPVSPTLTVAISLTPTSVISDNFPKVATQFSSDTPTPSPSPTISLTPTTTPLQNACTFPNFCTQGQYCEENDRLSASCGNTQSVCCKVKLESPDEKSGDKKGSTPLFEPLPTIFQPQPTNADIFLPPTRIPFTPPFLANLTPTPTTYLVTYSNTSNISPTLSIPTIIPQIDRQAAFQLPASPTKIIEEELIFPTITPFNVENITFERPTPTRPPRRNIIDIITAPGNFINSLFRNIFFKIIGR